MNKDVLSKIREYIVVKNVYVVIRQGERPIENDWATEEVAEILGIHYCKNDALKNLMGVIRKKNENKKLMDLDLDLEKFLNSPKDAEEVMEEDGRSTFQYGKWSYRIEKCEVKDNEKMMEKPTEELKCLSEVYVIYCHVDYNPGNEYQSTEVESIHASYGSAMTELVEKTRESHKSEEEMRKTVKKGKMYEIENYMFYYIRKEEIKN